VLKLGTIIIQFIRIAKNLNYEIINARKRETILIYNTNLIMVIRVININTIMRFDYYICLFK